NVDPDFYIMRERDIDEVFPWDFIDCGVTKKFLQREWLRSKEEKVTKNCKAQCNGCGCAEFDCGICIR
nr:B12-binding domain-containing radical SAM protein [Lachnospiraceae bacterium]